MGEALKKAAVVNLDTPCVFLFGALIGSLAELTMWLVFG